ncbi:hypothetical protein AB6A40_003572 [Gnathostoma spinigerum]|uniref:Uncharacterized protein n=1 Tax=Gnathostoma spinigerum TaxID=75299 RepID=A0ABD6EA43_9BILA
MVDSIRSPDKYATDFDPFAYFEHYYSSAAMEDGTRLSLFALPIFARVIAKSTSEEQRQTLIDIGAGPTVYSALCFRDVVKRIYLTDYTEQCLNVLSDWVEGKCSYDWEAAINVIRRSEGVEPGVKDYVGGVVKKTREVIRAGGIYHVNVHVNPCCLRLAEQQFDILVSIFCLESACSTYEEYVRAMGNMLQLLRPGGHLILGSVLELDSYDSGRSILFSLLHLTEEAIYEALEKHQMDMSSLKKYVLYSEGVMILCVTKTETVKDMKSSNV